jgi:predicted nucleic acid-binding protein
MTTYTADTSMVVPALTSWHESHELAANAVSSVTRLPAHVVLESIAVLTRLPHGLAVPVDTAVTVIGEAFPDTPWILTSDEHRDLVTRVGASRLRGGQIYDALIGATAHRAGAIVLSRDRRAQPAYRAVGAQVEDVGG